jgi:integrase
MASLFRRTGAGRSGAWLAKFKGADGRYVVRSTRTTDKAAAARVAAKWEADARLRLEGVIQPEVEAETKAAAESIETLIKAYEAKLKAAGRTADHVSLTLLRLRRIADYCGWKSAKNIKADGLNRYAIAAKDKGRSAQTIHHEITVAKGFSSWLTKLGKLKADPLKIVQKPNAKADRRHVRRMLLPEEWAWLGIALSDEVERFGMTAKARGLLYRLAIETGLRAGELRSLKVSSISLDSESPTVNLGAAQTKNRKGARQSISLALADELRAYATGESAAPLFNLPRKWEMVTMLRADVEAARALWLADADCPEERNIRTESDFLKVRTAAGVLDFHSLRHSTGSWLARSGVAPHIVQKVMRHSTMELTFGTYGHLFGDELQSAVGKVAVSLRPVGRISATKGTTKNVTKRAPELTLEAPEAKAALRGGYVEYAGKNADGEGFEPPEPLRVRRFSKPVP